MKRRYMVLSGWMCLVFAYANILAGKTVLGYICGLSALLLGLFMMYMMEVDSLHWLQVIMHIPFVYGCVKLLQMPYDVSFALGIVGFMSVGYSLMVQMMAKQFTMKECKALMKSLFVMGCSIAIVWIVSFVAVMMHFEWILVGNDWMIVWDAMSVEVISMVVLVGLYFVQVGSFLVQRNELLLN